MNNLSIDIGSGPWPRMYADVRMDLHPWDGVNCVHDLLETPYPFDNETFQTAYMGDVIEHIYIFDVDRVLTEIHRIMKVGCRFEIYVPDFRWIAERIVNNDWKEKSNVEWLNPTDDPWKNAMAYWFGGFHHEDRYKMAGMGHVNGFDFDSLKNILEKNGFKNIERVPDYRNPEPARGSVLKVICSK
jgi:predicted SAM-dependent methyltransferase